MKKLIFMFFVVYIWSYAIFNATRADANEYNTAVIGHIITQKVQGNNVDTSVLEAEVSKLAYNFALEMTDVLEKHLPVILESLATEIRQNADKEYKCKLLEGGSYECRD
tara:strand:+ start:781 stop:1107 length:327 start_codon:yes stop_codon:yes gene_type:complete